MEGTHGTNVALHPDRIVGREVIFDLDCSLRKGADIERQHSKGR